MFCFLQKIFKNNSLLNVIKFDQDTALDKKSDINLLTLNIENAEQTISSYFKKSNKNSLFVSCLFPMSGCEEKLARISDFLHSQDNEILDLSRSENLSIGTNFHDLRFILKCLEPNGFIVSQNSYKHTKYLNELKSFKPTIVPNYHYLNLNSNKILPIKNKKQFLSTENLLFFQREKLLKNGLLVVLLVASFQEKKISISKLKLHSLSISTTVNLLKIEKKIRQWWENKIVPDSLFLFSDPNIKQNIERRLSGLIRNYLSFENDVEMEDPLFLIFIK